MGQAKQRGTYEQRKAKAIADNGGEERPKRLGAYEKKRIERQVLSEVCGMWRNPLRRYFD